MANTDTYLTAPYLKFPKPAFRAMRLIGFDTGKSDLKSQHRGWLAETAHAIPPDRDFTIYIVGYASKLGFQGEDARQADGSNVTLSFERASQAARTMEGGNPAVTTHIEQFKAEGSRAYSAPGKDDSPLWRAVEVHVFLGDPPPPPADVERIPDCDQRRRYRKWSVAAPGGVTFNPVDPIPATVAANLVAFRREEGPQVAHIYLVPAMGLGYSWSGPKLKGIKEVIKNIAGTLNYSGMSWTSFTADTAFNFWDLEKATCQFNSVGSGVIKGYQKASVTLYGKVWYRQTTGKCMYSTKKFCENVDTSGTDYQWGPGASVVGGPMIQLK